MINEHECVIIEIPVTEVVVVQQDSLLVEIGIAGKQGPTGAYYYPYVEGTWLKFRNNGGLPNPDPFDLSKVLSLDGYATKNDVLNATNQFTAIRNVEILAILNS